MLVTGINGFVGEHVAREFKNLGYKVVGVGHDSKPNKKITGLITSYIECDLLNFSQVEDRIDFSTVSGMVHLAGLPNVKESFEQPRRYITDNGLMAFNILQRAVDSSMKGRALVVSTGALYDPDQSLPLVESSETNPTSPYAIGKLMAEDVTKYFRRRGMDAVITRPFNHLGPGQGPGFILPDLYNQLLVAKGSGVIKVGNIETSRDYTDVRDIARAYSQIITAPKLKYDTYNLCSGVSLSGRQIIDLLMQNMKISGVKVAVDKSKLRPNDTPNIVGSYERLHIETDWSPTIPIDTTVMDFINSQKK